MSELEQRREGVSGSEERRAATKSKEESSTYPERHALVTPPPSESIATGSTMGPTGATAPIEERIPLFSSGEANDLRTHWDRVQVGFVDEPRKAVQEADALVSSAVKRLTEGFVAERQKLERQWDRGDDVSTEDLRISMRRYRSFFTRLLSV